MSNTLHATWAEYTRWLEANVPEAFANLASGASDEQLKELAEAIGLTLPPELIALLRLNNGQKNIADCCALPGLAFLSTTEIAKWWQNWADFRDGETPEALESHDDYARALDPGVRDKYTDAGWIPLFRDGGRNDYIGLDMAPDEGGIAGQVINFGRDEDQHFIAASELTVVLAFYLSVVKEGECVVDAPEPPDYPFAWFKHPMNSIDLLRKCADERRAAAAVKPPPSAAEKNAPKPSSSATTAAATLKPQPEHDPVKTMNTLSARYPELVPLHEEFMRALAADPEPQSYAAYLWYEAINFDRDPSNPSATTRGQDSLNYMREMSELSEVPGQVFPKGQDPAKVCGPLISKNAADLEGPYKINFRYDRNAEGVWSGGFNIETSARHDEIVKGRAKYDKAIADAMRATWTADTESLFLAFVNRKDEAGQPTKRLQLVTKRGKGAEYLELEPPLRQAWDALLGYLRSQGVRHVEDTDYRLNKQNSRLRDGDNVKIRYCL